MKLSKKSIYRYIFFAVLTLAIFFSVKQFIFSNWLKNKALDQLTKIIRADSLTIGSAGFDFNRFYLNNIRVVSGGLNVDLKEFSTQYNVFDLIFSTENGRRFDKVKLDCIRFSIRQIGKNADSSDFKLNNLKYQKLLRSLTDFSFINRLEINDLNVDYYSDSVKIELLKNLHGQVFYKDVVTITTDFKGRLLDSQLDNISLKSLVDCRYASAGFDLTLLSSDLPDALKGDSLYKIYSGTYSGKFNLEINKENNNKINTSGSLVVNNLNGRLLNKVNLSDMEGVISFNNGLFFLNTLTGSIQGSAFDINGSINGLIKPEIDLNLILPKISPELLRELTKMQQNRKEFQQLDISGEHSLYLHAYGQGDYLYDFRYDGAKVTFQNKYNLKNLICSGRINDSRVIIQEFTCQTDHSQLKASGEYHWAGQSKNLLTGKINLNGALFKENPEFSKLKGSNLHSDLSGNFKFQNNKWSADSQLAIKDSLGVTILAGDFKLKDKKCLFDLKNNLQQPALSASYDTETGYYSLEGRQLTASINNFVELPDFLKAEKKLEFEIQGNHRNTHFRLSSKDSLSLLFGNLIGTAAWQNDSLVSVLSFEPALGHRFPLPLKTSVIVSKKIAKIRSLFIGDYLLRGRAEYDFLNKSLTGLFQADSLNFGSLKTDGKISTCTDFRLRLSGTADQPNATLWIKEHHFLFSELLPDSAALNGELEAHLENKRVRLEKIFLYRQKQKLLTCSGALEKDGQIKISAYGRFDLLNLLNSYGLNSIKGNLDYRIEAGGSVTSPDLISFSVRIKDGELFGEKISNCNLLLQDNKNNQVEIKEFNLSSADQLDLKLSGILPYKLNDSLSLRGKFRCNLFKIAGNYVDFLHGSSINEGSFTVGGPLKKPRLTGMELYFLDGNMEIPGVFKRLSRFNGKAEMGSDLKFRLVELVALSDAENHRMVFKNYHGLNGFDDVEIPGGINFGTLALNFPDGGITARAPYLMKNKDYGNFTLTGHHGNEFYVGKKYGILALSGKAIVRNLAFTYPFLDEKVFTTWQPIPGDETENDYPGLYLDLEIIPANGISYYYEGGTDERSVWEKIKASFDIKKNRDINNVWININNQTKGLKITGNPLEYGQPVLSGDIHGRGGKLSYVAWNFDIADVLMRFDDIRDKDGNIDPYLSGTGKTRIRSKMDSTGYSGFEELFIKVVSKENGVITDYEGARFSKYFIEILDDQGSPWLNKMEENAKNIDAKGTSLDLLNQGIDDRVLHPFMIPLERALADFFGLQFSLNPRITKNLSSENFFTENNKNYFGNLFEGSEVFITYPKDNFSLTLHSRYVGLDIYAKDIQQEFGYQNEISLDYYLGNYIYSSAGYRYNTLDKSSGYNLGLTYRYRFQTLETQFAILRRWWHKTLENLK